MTDPAIAAREASILGHPSRLPPVNREAILDEVREATRRFREGIFPGAPMMPDENIPKIMFTMHPFANLWRRVMATSMQLLGPEAKLPWRLQKLAILRTGWLLQAPYEWGEHVKQARNLGMSEAEVERIAAHGSAAPEWSALEANVLRAAEELNANAMVSRETWDALAADLTIDQLFELLILVGQFVTVAYFQNSMHVPLEDGTIGLTQR